MANLSNINGKFVVEQTTGYVGVGTTDPSYPIEVLNASAEIALNASGGSIYRLKSDSTDYFRINKNGVGDRLVIAGGGDVGIGISAPTTKLHIGGTAPGDSIIRQDSTVSGTNWEIGERAAGKWQIFEDDGDTIVATFMSTGNVGIGTTSPSSRLTVNKTKSGTDVENYDLIRLGLLGTGAVGDSSTIGWFSTSGTKTAGIEGISGLDNILYGELAFHVRRYTTDAYDEVMRINNRGNVGIGTDSPGARIDIKGVSGSPATSGTTQNGILRIQNNGNNNTLDVGQITSSPYGTWLQAADKSDLNPTYTYPILLNPLGGNVGIGTASPNAKLEIFGGGNTLRMDSAGNTAKTFLMRNVNTAIAEIKTDGNLDINIEDAGRTMRFLNGNIERIKINDAGNVFISTPIVNAFYGISLTYNNTNTADFTVNQATGQIKIGGVATGYFPTFYSSGTERMRITTGGQVQVGYYNTARGGANTTFMTGKSGTTYLELNGGDTSGEGGLLFADGSGGNYGLINYSHVSDIMQFYTASAERMRITSGGNIKINSTGTGDGFAYEQTITVKKTLGNNGVAIPVVYVGHTHAVQVTVVLFQSTGVGASGTGQSSTFYGAANTGMVAVQGSGAVSGITLAYLNTNPAGQDYVLTITPTFTSGNPPIAYVTVRGQSDQTMSAY